MGAGVRPGDPDRRAVAPRHQAVGADGELQRHGGAPFGDAEDMAERHLGRLLCQHAFRHLDARVASRSSPAAGGAGVGIAQRDHGAGRAGCGDDVGTGGAPAAGMSARFERDIEGGAAGALARLLKRNGFGMRPAARARSSPAK